MYDRVSAKTFRGLSACVENAPAAEDAMQDSFCQNLETMPTKYNANVLAR